MPYRYRRYVWLLALATCVLPKLALAINYKVEVVIFQNRDGASGVASNSGVEAADYGQAVDVRSGGRNIRPASADALDSVSTKLGSSGHYRVLTHVAWVQPGLGSRSAVPVRIESPGVLDGTIKISLSRYLHTYTDFTYSGSGGTGPVRIRDHRRMRSRELHYIDNPLFGIVIQITPV